MSQQLNRQRINLKFDLNKTQSGASCDLPQPTMPSPLIMVVCESVPTKLSGYTNPSTLKTTRPRHSRFTWWTMPEPGGTIRMFLRAFAPHCKDKKWFLWGMQEARPVLTSAQRVYWRGGIVLWLNKMFREFITMVFLHNDLRNLWKINYVTELQKIKTGKQAQ